MTSYDLFAELSGMGHAASVEGEDLLLDGALPHNGVPVVLVLFTLITYVASFRKLTIFYPSPGAVKQTSRPSTGGRRA